MLVVLGACGDPGSGASPALESPAAPSAATSPATTTAAPSNDPDFLEVRPGDRLDAFLGRSFGPSHWTDLQESVQSAVDGCISDNGGSPPDRPLLPDFETLDLRETDLAAFRQQYGYGIVEERRVTSELEAGPIDSTPVDHELMALNAQLEQECAAEVDAIWQEVLPSQDLNLRHQALLAELASDADYLAVGDSWKTCMQGLGYPTDVVSPFFSKGLVDALLIEAAASGVMDFDALQAAELSAFSADAECLASSGAGELMLSFEGDVLQTLRSEFPDYEPPTNDPAGMAWSS